MKKKVRWLLRNGFTFTGKKTIKGKDYLYARKGKVFKSAGPYSIAEPYLHSLTSRKEPEPAAPRGADERFAAARREFDQLEADAIADPSRLRDYVRELVYRRDPDLGRRFSLLAGSEGPKVLDGESVNSSHEEKLLTAAARGEEKPSYYDHVVEEMKKWIEGAIESKRGRLAPLGTRSGVCAKCGSTLEGYPDPTDFKEYRVWCDSCSSYWTWSCDICDQTLRRARDGKEGPCLICPRCGRGYRFTKPIKLNSPQTNDGWRLLGLIMKSWPEALDGDPRKLLGNVRWYEGHREFCRLPGPLGVFLRSAGVHPMDAHAIVNVLLDTTTNTGG